MPTRIPISIWRKQEVLRWIEEDGDGVPTRAIKHFSAKGWKLDGGSIRRWWRDREQLLAADPASRRRAGGGRRPLSGAMEEAAGVLFPAQWRRHSTMRLWKSGSRRRRLPVRGLAIWPG
ncbi:hypothetical protein PC123_g24680 [Phytophthora cactorum]|nr:hypothetical protein PC123_g24680 [Phytophthora cactorum]